MTDDFWQFGDLIKWVADSLQISLEVKESQHELLDILYSVTPSRVTLPISAGACKNHLQTLVTHNSHV